MAIFCNTGKLLLEHQLLCSNSYRFVQGSLFPPSTYSTFTPTSLRVLPEGLGVSHRLGAEEQGSHTGIRLRNDHSLDAPPDC
jgi:hypothetical protein